VPRGSLPLASSRLPSPTRDTEATDHNQQISFDKIWYAAYGSNLFPHRLNWYLHGGKAPTSSHWYTPCPDDRPIQARFAGKLPYRLYFARRSLIWGGSKAFIDRIPEPDISKHAQAAFYLISRKQFEHVVWQENWQSELTSPLSLDLEGLAESNRGKAGRHLASSGYHTDYNALLLGGTARNPDGSEKDTHYPVVSFTLKDGLQKDELAPPSKPYLQHIAEGLRQTFPLWDGPDVASYLASAPGANVLDPQHVLEAVAEHLHIEDPRMSEHPPPPLLAYQGGRGAEVKIWSTW